MTRQEIIKTILGSPIVNNWHWFGYHFKIYLLGEEHPFAKSIVDCLTDIGAVYEGVDSDYIQKLSSINGEEKNYSHYEQQKRFT